MNGRHAVQSSFDDAFYLIEKLRIANAGDGTADGKSKVTCGNQI